MFKYVEEKFNLIIKTITSIIFTVGGHIPKSIAIIMDGNRRFALKKKVEKIKGHEEGLSKLLQVISWCLNFGIKELTVFAFSIDNFNRPKEEVDALMLLAQQKFAVLSDKNEYLNKHGVKVCFYGNMNYLTYDMKKCFIKMERDTEKNNNIKLNVCFPYNSNEEMYQSVRNLDNINNFNINRDIFESGLYGGYNCNPDILIRTSGEVRLSNFLLYQTRFSILFFVDKYWPDFNYIDFLNILIRYNIDYKSYFRKIKFLEDENNFSIKNLN
jgi:ditrans,polycis-polyprenyl diphosphate synthase